MLCAGQPLFMRVDTPDDNIIDKNRPLELRNWTEIDNERLSFVFQDLEDAQPQVVAFAQDLIRRCLQRDPSERPCPWTPCWRTCS